MSDMHETIEDFGDTVKLWTRINSHRLAHLKKYILVMQAFQYPYLLNANTKAD
jgi:hypothetical protein